jgi:RNA polymerase sigma-70 factor (ECF subfamily)
VVDRADTEQSARAALANGAVALAAEQLLVGYGPELHGFLRATMRDDDAAGDVFGMFSEDLLRGLGKFRGEASLRTWCYALLRHAAARWRRDPLRRRGRREHETSAIGKLAHHVRTQTSVWRRTELKDRVRALRETLSVDEQELLILRLDRGMDWDDVARALLDEDEACDADALRRKSAAARKRFERVKDKLRDKLRDQSRDQ